MKEIMRTKEEIARFLEDPQTYSSDANIAEEVIDVLLQKFKIERMQRNILEKINIVGGLFNDKRLVLDFEYLNDARETLDKFQNNQ